MRNLLEFISKHCHWLVFVVLEVISLTLLFRYNSYQGSVWFTSANALTGRIFEISSGVNSFFSLRQANEQLTLRNFHLERKVSRLAELYADATADTTAAERAELEAMAKYKVTAAKVISNETAHNENLMTIDKGKADGVREDMGVACGNGLVGLVYLASDHYAIVMPVINTKSHISCNIRGTGYFGYLRWYGGDPSTAYMEDVPRHARFKRGDWVETSGFSSIFPPGVLVGRIETIYNSQDGLSYRLKVRLTTDFGNVRDVCVIHDETIAERLQLMNAARDSLGLNVRN